MCAPRKFASDSRTIAGEDTRAVVKKLVAECDLKDDWRSPRLGPQAKGNKTPTIWSRGSESIS
jgi:hypothetical protein